MIKQINEDFDAFDKCLKKIEENIPIQFDKKFDDRVYYDETKMSLNMDICVSTYAHTSLEISKKIDNYIRSCIKDKCFEYLLTNVVIKEPKVLIFSVRPSLLYRFSSRFLVRYHEKKCYRFKMYYTIEWAN